MNLPKSFVVQITLDANPLPGAFFMVRIPMRSKNDFWLCFGPTEASGHFTVSREFLLDAALREKNMFMMDYLDPEHDRTGNLAVEPMNVNAVERALNAFAQFKDFMPYPVGYEQGLSAYLGQLREHGKGRLAARTVGETEEPIGNSEQEV